MGNRTNLGLVKQTTPESSPCAFGYKTRFKRKFPFWVGGWKEKQILLLNSASVDQDTAWRQQQEIELWLLGHESIGRKDILASQLLVRLPIFCVGACAPAKINAKEPVCLLLQRASLVPMTSGTVAVNVSSRGTRLRLGGSYRVLGNCNQPTVHHVAPSPLFQGMMWSVFL